MPRTQLEKVWLAGGVLAGLLLIVIGYAFFIGPQRSSTSSVRGQVSTEQSQNDVLRSRISVLQKQSANLATYQTALATAQRALPATSGLPDFLRTLQSLGNATQTNVTALNVLEPADVTGLAVAAAPKPVSTTSSASGSGSSGSAGSSGSSGASNATKVNGARVYALPITATVTGTTSALLNFLTQLQQVQPRAVLISQIDFKNDTSQAAGKPAGSTTSLQLTMQAFVAPSNPAESAQLAAASHK